MCRDISNLIDDCKRNGCEFDVHSGERGNVNNTLREPNVKTFRLTLSAYILFETLHVERRN